MVRSVLLALLVLSGPPLKGAIVPPIYPPAAAKARMFGLATVEFTVSPDGSASLIRVVASNPLFAQAAQSALAESRFEQVAGVQNLTFEFQLLPAIPGLCSDTVRQVSSSCFTIATVPPEIPARGGCVFPPPFVTKEPNTYTFYPEALRLLPLQ